uniref:Uncharacterized protein n=1 Tax=Oryza punctata TaxID=4537 RepID=A0A0E0M801_ORYPU
MARPMDEGGMNVAKRALSKYSSPSVVLQRAPPATLHRRRRPPPSPPLSSADAVLHHRRRLPPSSACRLPPSTAATALLHRRRRPPPPTPPSTADIGTIKISREDDNNRPENSGESDGGARTDIYVYTACPNGNRNSNKDCIFIFLVLEDIITEEDVMEKVAFSLLD